MKILVKAYSGEHGNTDAAVIDVNVRFILDLWENWPKIPDLQALMIYDCSEWYGYSDICDELDQGPMLQWDGVELGDERRTEAEYLIVFKDYCYWECREKHTDIVCSTNVFNTQDLKKLVPVMDQLKESIDNNGV